MENNDMNNTGNGFHVHVYSPGNNIAQSMTVTYNGPVYNGQKKQEEMVYTDEEIAKALININGKNKASDSKQKWAGAHWGCDGCVTSLPGLRIFAIAWHCCDCPMIWNSNANTETYAKYLRFVYE